MKQSQVMKGADTSSHRESAACGAAQKGAKRMMWGLRVGGCNCR